MSNFEYPEYGNTPSIDHYKNKSNKSSNNFRAEMPKARGQENVYNIRLILNRHNADEDPFAEVFMHFKIGKQGGFVCPKYQHNEECAVCEHVKLVYQKANKIATDSGIDATNSKAMRENPQINALYDIANDLKAKKRYYVPIIERGKEEDGVKWWSISETLYNKIESDIRDEEKVLDPYRGFDSVVKLKNDGKQFPMAEHKFRSDRKPYLPGQPAEAHEALLASVPDALTQVRTVSSADTIRFMRELFEADDSYQIDMDEPAIQTTASVGIKREVAYDNNVVVKSHQPVVEESLSQEEKTSKVRSLIADMIPDDDV